MGVNALGVRIVTKPKNLNTELPDPETDIDNGTWSDLEEEKIESDPEEITEPFDPTKIRVGTRQITVDLLLSRIQQDKLDLARLVSAS